MSDLGLLLDRRQFLCVAGTVISAPLSVLEGIVIAQSKQVTFEQALNDADNSNSLRQKYLDQLFRNLPSPYVERVIYSHASSQQNKSSGNSGQTSTIFAEVSRGGFGVKGQCEITIYKESFEPDFIDLNGKKIQIMPTEKFIVSTLMHEYRHTEDYEKGINFGDGVIIDNLNFDEINPKLLEFVTDGRAFADEISYTWWLNKITSNGDTLYHPAYIYNLDFFDRFMKNKRSEIKVDELNSFDKRLYNLQMIKVKPILKDVERVFSDIGRRNGQIFCQ